MEGIKTYQTTECGRATIPERHESELWTVIIRYEDGEVVKTSFGEFCDANMECLPEECERIGNGETVTIGGGASPLSRIHLA